MGKIEIDIQNVIVRLFKERIPKRFLTTMAILMAPLLH
jgi:hypothetical protein